MTHPRKKSGRRGFTLVELLVVLVIIAVLIALLVPAVMGAVRRAKAASVQAEINNLAQALADFKSKMGDYPPSRVVLNETGGLPTSPYNVASGGDPVSGTATDISVTALSQRTVTALRKFWPRASLLVGSPVFGTGSTTWYDFNGNGIFDTYNYVLEGHECLVFFLGGIPLNTGNQISVTGFGKNPVNPFSNSIVGNAMYSANRNPPFFEFNPGRLSLTSVYAGNTTTGIGISTGNPGYLDSLDSQGGSSGQNFYAYFSTNLGTGYDPNDVNFNNANYEIDGNGTHPMCIKFYAPATLPSITPVQYTVSPSPNPYTSSLPFGSPNVVYQNSQSFQIISPGLDGGYGYGGLYNLKSTNGSALDISQNPLSNSSDPGQRNIERDNLTNFHNGTLE